MNLDHKLRCFAFAALSLTWSTGSAAQLGGTEGIVLPYQGTLYQDGAPVTGMVDFEFPIFNVATGGSACQVIAAPQTAVASGTFTAKLNLSDTCVRGLDVYLGTVVSGVTLPGRQRVYPGLGASTSGTGDFHVTGNLAAQEINAAALTTDLVDTVAVVSGTVDAESLEVTGPTVIRAGSTPTTSIEPGKVLVVTSVMGAGSQGDGGVEFRHDNLTQGVGIGYAGIYATGTNPSQPLHINSRGTDPLHLNTSASAPTLVGSQNLSVSGSSRYSRSLERLRVIAPFTTSRYRSYTAIPESTLLAYCGDGDGCTISFRMVNCGSAPQDRTAASRGPMHFDYGETVNGNQRAWRISNTDAAGLDGNGGVNHVIQFWDCYFTDAVYSQGSTAASDGGRGMGLLNTGNSYSAECQMIIDD